MNILTEKYSTVTMLNDIQKSLLTKKEMLAG